MVGYELSFYRLKSWACKMGEMLCPLAIRRSSRSSMHLRARLCAKPMCAGGGGHRYVRPHPPEGAGREKPERMRSVWKPSQ